MDRELPNRHHHPDPTVGCCRAAARAVQSHKRQISIVSTTASVLAWKGASRSTPLRDRIGRRPRARATGQDPARDALEPCTYGSSRADQPCRVLTQPLLEQLANKADMPAYA